MRQEQKTTATRMLEMLLAKNFLPTKNSKAQREGNSRRHPGPRGSRKQTGSRRNPIPHQRAIGNSTSRLQEAWTPVFPAKTTRKLRYSTTLTLTATSGVITSYLFTANGLYDPDVTGTGHQPMGFDQLMLSYNHYCVLSSTINVLFRNQGATSPTVCIRVAPDITVPTVVDTILEYGLMNLDQLPYKGTDEANKRLTESVSIAKIQGVRQILDVEVLSGTVAANPTEQTYYQLLVWDTTKGPRGGVVFCFFFLFKKK